MDGTIDLRLVMTVAGMLVSVAGAMAVAKSNIKIITEKLEDIEARLRKSDARADKLWTVTETQEQRLDVLAKMSSPENLRRDQMQMAQLLTEVEHLRKDVDHMIHIHNSKHPPVSSTRTAE